MTGRRRLAAAGGWALVVACLWRQVEAPPWRPSTTVCRPALQVDGRLVCGDDSLAALRTMCPFAVFGDGDAITLADDCRVARMSGVEQLALGMRLDANSASLSELEALPGIGPTLARRIIEARPYRSVAELDRVSGIGVARLAGIRDHLRVREMEPGRSIP